MLKMKKNRVNEFRSIEEANQLMRRDGILLVTESKDRKPNAMTIGWGMLGTMWRRSVFVVAVRLSRYTHKLIEDSDSFTVCLPSPKMSNWLDYCGNNSGRDVDKFKELGMTASHGISVKAPYIVESPVHFECEILYRNLMKPGQLKKEVESEVYPNMDLHTLYYGEVKGAYATDDAKKELGI
jgi:flavin reductase (DIM6/NTAB) family NADH-FMN oxidoreductase RutF